MPMTSLNGDWEGLVDREGVLSFDRLAAHPSWKPVPVPANWMRTDLGDVLGTVWYRKRFPMTSGFNTDEDLWLHFGGVDYQAVVWLNGQLLGEHEGYFQPFAYRITQALVPGSNELVVKVTAAREAEGDWPNRKRQIKGLFNHWDCRPGSWDPVTGQDQGSGGIWNSVWIETVPRVFIHAVRATPQWLPKEGRARVSFAVEVVNLAERAVSVTLAAVMVGDDSEVGSQPAPTMVVTPGLNRVQSVVTVENPRLWWSWDMGEPYVYSARMTLDSEYGTHQREIEVGIRSIELGDEGAWIVNGRRVFVRGTNIMPTQWLSEYTPERIAKDVRLIREAGFNAVRVCVHVNREAFYQACDRAGLLLWQDFPLQWNYSQDDTFAAEAVRQARDMIEGLYNHPSIVVWCMQNEPTEEQQSLVHLLDQTARGLDASRVTVPEAAFAQHPYPGWYHGDLHEYARIPGAPFVTEFGAQALPSAEALRTMLGDKAWPPDWEAWGYHDFQYHQTFHVANLPVPSSLEAFASSSQAYQARLLKVAVEHYRRAKWQPMVGFFQFMFVDCWPSITWSVVDYDREPKLAYRTLKEICQPVMVSIPGDAAAGDGVYTVDRGFTVPVHVVNDLPIGFPGCIVTMDLFDEHGSPLGSARTPVDLDADHCGVVTQLGCTIPGTREKVSAALRLRLTDPSGEELAQNHYAVTLVRLGGPLRYLHHD